MTHELKILMVEDSSLDAELLIAHLQKHGIRTNHERVDSENDLNRALKEKWDVLICDYNLPSFSAPKAISLVKAKQPDLPIVVVSGSVGEELAVETIRAGASDYVMKSNLSRLVPAIERGIREHYFRIESRQIEGALKKKEEELRQAQKLEAIGQLAGGIAHDFNNILATILLQIETLLDDSKVMNLSQSSHQRLLNGLQQIKKSSDRATNLTRQLLAFSRKQVLQPKVLKLNDLILNLEQMLRPLIEENIQFRNDLADGLKNIKADPGHIEQVLMNLVINSRDAMASGGTLTITTRNVNIDETIARQNGAQPGSYVLLEVRDTGTGIPPEIQTHLFEPFFTTKPVGKGTGLGLSTVYGIVKQNRGLIFLESEPGRGTAFRVYFPECHEEIETQIQSQDRAMALSGTETILFVEDEENLREIVCATLKKNGYRVLSASNGSEALDRLTSNSSFIHLIITDVVLPLMGGAELAAEALKISPQTKILFQSGYIESTLIHRGVEAGEVHFLEKPYRSIDLLTKIRTILSSVH